MPVDIVCAGTIEWLIEEWRRTINDLSDRKTLNVVGVGAHPDDPETGCGGTLAQFAQKGHNVHILYLTRGEAGRNEHQTEEPLADIRTAEAVHACEILRATPLFAGQIDGKTVADAEHAQKFGQKLLSADPDIVFTHWPHDTHADHRNVYKLTHDAWETSQRKFMLVFYEVMTDIQTQQFKPNFFIDITSVLDIKRGAIFSHACQNPLRFYAHHVSMEEQRGRESNVSRAEAFYVMPHHAPNYPPHPYDAE